MFINYKCIFEILVGSIFFDFCVDRFINKYGGCDIVCDGYN